ncbi:SDR family oxidoreductase [Candidatus Pelagibacter sp. Uisw_106]|uniref:SDR family oxidoreductase n=1 Tax=Candidatus Pelagibacter sp. Uisw_106 TaxID=3230984 RepID=UPI0039EC3ACC
MKVLITGSNGFLGSILKKKLKKHTIIGNDINIYNKRINFNNSFNNIKSKKLREIDVLVHLAGVSTNYDPPDNIYKKIALKINSVDTIKLAAKAKKNGVKKFIFASSASVYGAFKGKLAVESSASSPSTSYAISKKRAEKEILKLADKNFKVIIFRMVTLYGLSSRMRFDVLINNLAINYIKNKEIVLRSNGRLIRPQIHVLDVVQFYQQAIDNNSIKSQIINIGRSDYNINILSLAKQITNSLKCSLSIGQQDTDERSYKVCFKKQNKIFKNIKFKKNLLFSFKEIIKNYKKNHNFNKYKYYNLSTLENLKEKKLITTLLK